MSIPNKVTYKDAGVDIERGDQFVARIKEKVESTYTDRVLHGVGGFAALYKMHGNKLLATGTDGVGTKLKIAQRLGRHDTVGIDLVAMCINDVICTGATPMFFLDYVGTGKLELDVAEAIVSGVAEGCKQSEMALIGGETAELPDMYPDGEYDLAGFAVGEVDQDLLIDGSKIRDGDTLFALASSGFHSNGFSLVRKLIREDERRLLEELLTPTRLYWPIVKEIKSMASGLANITGGGLANIPRMNKDFDYMISFLPDFEEIPPIFLPFLERSGLSGKELYQTWNMGVGFVVATSEPDKLALYLNDMREPFWRIGHVQKGEGRCVVETEKESFIL